MTELPTAVVVAAAHVCAEFVRRCHTAGQPVPHGVLPTLNALTRAVAEFGHGTGATHPNTQTWIPTTEYAQLTGIPIRTLRRNATAHGGRKVGAQWTFPAPT